MKINCHAALQPKAALVPFAYEPSPLADHDVEIAISHSGICHSDLHLIDNNWNSSSYPLVPGHEIIGTVADVGRGVTHLRVGQRVGVGWQRSACLTCEYCLGRGENLCRAQQATCVGHHGGFAERIRTDGRFAFAIPDGLDAAATAPLLCGGATVYAPLKRHGIDGTRSVGVIGIGGLGHIAVLFLRALGCEITAFSSSADKRDETLRMGAHHFVCSTDSRAIRTRADTLDFLLSTVHARLDWITYLQTLKPNGTLCLVGSPPGVLQIPAVQLVTGQRSICGSDIADRATIVEMLGFAARQRIAPEVQLMPLSEVNAAIDRLRKNQVRYRMVLTLTRS
jgi:alcohol/geraniol dehydrogenase (NADP+)